MIFREACRRFKICIKTKKVDLWLIIVLTLLYLLFTFLPALNRTVARTVMGLLLVLFSPGYSLISALFPTRDLDGIQRVALSFALSVAIVSLLSFVLNYTPFGIRLEPISILLSAFIVSFSLIAWFRCTDLPEQESFIVRLEQLFKSSRLFKGVEPIDRILSMVRVTSIILSIIALVSIVSLPKAAEKFTKFYILGPEGRVSNYPTNPKVGEVGEVVIGIVNHEHENVTYRLEVKFNGSIVHKEYVLLVHNQTWEAPFRFLAKEIGEDQKFEFLLYKGEEKEPYRAIHLWVDVEV